MSFPELPEASPVRSVAAGAALGVISGVPVVGAIASSTIAAAVASKQRARDEEFWSWIAARVRMLERDREAFFDPGDDEFFAAVHRALRASRETADQDKRRMLAEAVVNAGSWSSVDLSRRERYLDLISTLTPAHIRLLRFLDTPREWLDRHRPGATTEIAAIPNWSFREVMKRFLFDGDETLTMSASAAVADLIAERLGYVDLSRSATYASVLETRTSEDGADLLRFLGDTVEDESGQSSPGGGARDTRPSDLH
ncbi:hypothetical protein [Plantibacter flavus]|uniref:hypothetical protein n=1 Tax=Plantibacter flavus TaxID=150123 RepID=UPI00117EA577|nr:hypothetical protein [Plantibacter flavus]